MRVLVCLGASLSLFVAAGCAVPANHSAEPSHGICNIVDVNQPYRKMMRGFENRSISEVVSAYETNPLLGPVSSPTFRNAQDMIDAFRYVETENGTALDIEFKIIHREHSGAKAVDVGYYFIDGWPLEFAFGRFTSLISCDARGDWRFEADMSTPATQSDWESATCIEHDVCASIHK
jgi:hypothetical protein